MVALYVQQTQGLGQLVDVSMHAACNVTTEAATYEWLVAQATVQRYTFRHAAVRLTPPRLMTAADGRTVIGALPRRASEFRALANGSSSSAWSTSSKSPSSWSWASSEEGCRSPRWRQIPRRRRSTRRDRTPCGSWRNTSPRRRSSSRHSGAGSRPPMLASPEEVAQRPALRCPRLSSRDLPRRPRPILRVSGPGLPGAGLAVAGPRARAPLSTNTGRRCGPSACLGRALHRRRNRPGVIAPGGGVMEKFERRVIVTGLGLSDIGRHARAGWARPRPRRRAQRDRGRRPAAIGHRRRGVDALRRPASEEVVDAFGSPD